MASMVLLDKPCSVEICLNISLGAWDKTAKGSRKPMQAEMQYKK
jgi:hypothetical protein